jgi:hypothetical protein
VDRQWHAFEADQLRGTRAWNLVVRGEFARRAGEAGRL